MKTEPTGTYLDLVRELSELARDNCDPACSLPLHRMEAAAMINLFIKYPGLLWKLRKVAVGPLADR